MKIIKLSDNREMVSAAAEWFSSKWNVPKEAYKESMGSILLGYRAKLVSLP